MAKFGRTLFGGSRFIFWSLTPILIICGLLLLLNLGDYNESQLFLILFIETIIILFIISLYYPVKYKWAARTVTGAIFASYLYYVVDQFIIKDIAFKLFGPRSEASPRNALLGLIVIGIPCLLYTLFGRFTLRKEQGDDDEPNINKKY